SWTKFRRQPTPRRVHRRQDKGPHASPLARFAAPRGRFCLGAARRQKKPPRFTACAVRCPQGALLPWGGPAAKEAPTLHRLRGSLPPGGAFCLGAARRQKKKAEQPSAVQPLPKAPEVLAAP